MKYGYGRVSSARQDPSTQIEELVRYGVPREHIETEVVSGAKAKRKVLYSLLEELTSGDELHVTKLDRLGRSADELNTISKHLEANSITLVIGGKAYDPTDPKDALFFGMLTLFAEFERALLIERTKDRLDYLRDNGIKVGRARATTPAQEIAIFKMKDRGFSYREIREATGLSNGVISRILKDADLAETYAADPALRRDVRKLESDREKAMKRLASEYAKAADTA
ncbi:recombinase family protein [Nocardioides sp. Root140]|uniref:recombinase family protein n=1 Tax=Nocardioides sp. Root140 TaxID=1736460 RepID=UPI0006FA50E9|nr:recombinase family protein [Nocardioides sp. Root140]KQY61830.1 hypothetical protein ASD30_25140 [Nocardioides sp. Root140]